MRGGLHLLAHKQRSGAASLAYATVPQQLSIVIDSSYAQLYVSIGEQISLGQIIAAREQPRERPFEQLWVHAPASGVVVAIDKQDRTLTITIDNDGRDTRHPSLLPITSHQDLAAAELRELIAQAGIVGLGGATFSTAAKLSAAADKKTELLIINGAECEPFITCDEVLMRERAADVVLGTQVLLHATAATQAIIAIENNKPASIEAMSDAVKHSGDARITVQIVPMFFPAGGERQLVKTITGREVPSRGIPPDVGVLCHNVGTAAAIAQLIQTGDPLIGRIVTIAGSGVREPRNLIARFGTPIASLIADCGGYAASGYATGIERLIMGGPMMGVALTSDATTVSAATNCIIAATAEDIKPREVEMPCIRCGDCAYVCPAGLLPQQLLRYARLNDRAALNETGLTDCIECGCCDYVCPSQIPLASTFARAKQQ